jgi:DNA-directed RNA polymerase specialized sigma24 family protein
VTAMLSMDRLRHDEMFGAWLTGIALNLCRRLVRKYPLGGQATRASRVLGLKLRSQKGPPP